MFREGMDPDDHDFDAFPELSESYPDSMRGGPLSFVNVLARRRYRSVRGGGIIGDLWYVAGRPFAVLRWVVRHRRRRA